MVKAEQAMREDDRMLLRLRHEPRRFDLLGARYSPIRKNKHHCCKAEEEDQDQGGHALPTQRKGKPCIVELTAEAVLQHAAIG